MPIYIYKHIYIFTHVCVCTIADDIDGFSDMELGYNLQPRLLIGAQRAARALAVTREMVTASYMQQQ